MNEKMMKNTLSSKLRSFRRFPVAPAGTRAANSEPMRLLHLTISAAALCLVGALFNPAPALATPSIVVSVPDQTLALINDGVVVSRYPISTSKFGLGDSSGTYATPVGAMAIASKIGANAPLGAVFKNRRMTGEILAPNAPGRDPIVTRILWLRGLEKSNARAYARNIYI